MAVVPRGLCVVLTIWMACSRPSALLQSGSLHPEPWWAAKVFSEIRETAAKLRAARDLAGLESLYRSAYATAHRLGNQPAQITYLADLGNVHTLGLRYSEALADYLRAKEMAQAIGDWEDLELISLNLSSLYQQLWDEDSAMAAAQEARAASVRTGANHYRTQLLLMLARFHAGRLDPEASPLYVEGIEAARQQGDTGQEAQGWDLLGEDRLTHGDLDGAERALVEAYRMRVLHQPVDLRFSYRRLGALRLAEALAESDGSLRAQRLEEAARLTQRAIFVAVGARPGLESWLLLHQLGQIQEAQGQPVAALANFGAAVDQAALWYRTLPASDSSLLGANTALERRVFNSYVEAAARRALQTDDPSLAGESFMAEELNRASSLRETEALAPVWRNKLPQKYWQDLNLLRSEDSRLLVGGGDQTRAARLRLEISQMEAVAGIGFSLSNNENFRSLDSLSHFRDGLKESELFLSFHLNPRESYLWAVSRSAVRLYRLEAEDRIGAEVREFREAVKASRPGLQPAGEVERLGKQLYASLFGQLSPAEVQLPEWLVAAEGPLFEVPFAALVREEVHVDSGRTNSGRTSLGRTRVERLKSEPMKSAQGRAEYLVETNSVQIVPGAMLIRTALGKPAVSGRMVAVGDPIYNAADARWAEARWKDTPLHSFNPHWLKDVMWQTGWRSSTAGLDSMQLNRLAGSGREISESVKAWGGDSGTVLTGATSRREQFLNALTPPPAVIHLATHVLSAAEKPEQAFIAFSADASGRPELLATSDIAKLNVPGALVVMSGCATATGDVRGSAGVVGLTRAWMVAGASATIATGWSVQDSSGDLLPAFYRHWRTTFTADALRRSQLDMIHSGDWRSAPSYWAAYQLTGGGR